MLMIAACPLKVEAAAHHHRRRGADHPPASLTPAQKALAQVEAQRAALERKKAEQNRALQATQAAAAAAQAQARQDSARTTAYEQRTRRAESALDATNAQIAALTAEIGALQTRRNIITQDIARKNKMLQQFLPIAQRLSAAPDAALLVAPETVSESVEALSILGGFARLIHQQADTLQTRATDLHNTADSLEQQQQKLDTLLRRQSRTRDLDRARTSLAARREAAAKQNAQEASRAVERARQDADDLSSEINAIARQEAKAKAELEAEAQALKRAHRMTEARRASSEARALASSGTGVSSGKGHAPVAGAVSVAWRQSTEAGPATGITYAAAAGTPVMSPCAGRVEFAGPFRSFGEMLILDCGRNYRFVLSGLGALNVTVGSAVNRAARLGTMSESAHLLFVQLRHGAQTINPAPFL